MQSSFSTLPSPVHVNILIPMAGDGSRFAQCGWVRPKPLIDVAGKPMIAWVFENVYSIPPGTLPLPIRFTFIVIIRREHDVKFSIAAQLKALRTEGEIKIVYAEALTEGAACTALLASHEINNAAPLFIINSDQFLEWDSHAYWAERLVHLTNEKQTGICREHGNIVCFKHPMSLNDTKWSYASVDANSEQLLDVQEKKVISDNATVGAYYFRSGEHFVQIAQQMIMANRRVNNEFYVAPVYNEGVAQGFKYTLYFCTKFWGLGVPKDLVHFLYYYVRKQRKHLEQELLQQENNRDSLEKVAGTELHSALSNLSSTSTAVASVRLIAHRGNVCGVDCAEENKPAYLLTALSSGYDVELDLWLLDNGRWYLGHDKPDYMVDFSFLTDHAEFIWIHCKNGAALHALSSRSAQRVSPLLQYFFHVNDDFTLTSNSLLWTYPDKKLFGLRSIAVMFSNPTQLAREIADGTRENIYGICADNVRDLRQILEQVGPQRPFSPCAPSLPLSLSSPSITFDYRLNGRSMAIAFDLDGVLVESKELHYEAMNDAIREIAGDQYVITRVEHENIYDGLSTNQKLMLLGRYKNLPQNLYIPIFTRKQDLTLRLFKEYVQVNPTLVQTLRSLKQLGFPLIVCSNCIRSSVHALLEGIGALPLVDAYFSNEDVTQSKPHPSLYQKVLTSLGLSDAPRSVLVVEDSPKGWESACRAGVNILKVHQPENVNLYNILNHCAELENHPEFELNIVVPLARPTQQYWVDGPDQYPSEVPLHLADLSGKPVLQWMIENVYTRTNTLDPKCPYELQRNRVQFIFLVRENHDVKHQLSSLVSRITGYAPTCVVRVRSEQLGAVKTCLLAEGLIDSSTPVLIMDAGHYVRWTKFTAAAMSPVVLSPIPASQLSFASALSPSSPTLFENGYMHLRDMLLNTDGDVCLPIHESADPRRSYVQLKSSTQSTAPYVLRSREKQVISTSACNGLYYWREGRTFVNCAKSLVQRGEKQMAATGHVDAEGENGDEVLVQGQYFLSSVLNEAIERFSCKVFPFAVDKYWSIRSSEELNKFEREVLPFFTHSLLEDIYREMITRNHQQVQAVGTTGDQLLTAALNEEDDSRRCLAVYTLFSKLNWRPSKRFLALMDFVRTELGAEHCVFELEAAPLSPPSPSNASVLPGALHFTLMQAVRFDLFKQTVFPLDYSSVVQAILVNYFTCFEIEFNRLCLLPGSLVMMGDPSIDLNTRRHVLRKELGRVGYPLYEPYKSDICHTTLCRFTSPLSKEKETRLRVYIDEFQNAPQTGNLLTGESLGRLKIQELNISSATWRMRSEELIVPDQMRMRAILPSLMP